MKNLTARKLQNRLGALSIALTLILNVIACGLNLFTRIDDLLYPYAYSEHPVLSKTIDNDILRLFAFSSFLAIICIVTALFLSILGIYANRYISSKRAIFFFLLIFSSTMIIFSGSKFIELWNLNLVTE